ncbi:MAG: 50S ribosomal protein L16 [Chlamydiales bacterium]
MPLMPKRTKYRKQQKGSLRGLSKRGNFVEFGDFGMLTLERGRITAQQLEACRIAINRYCKRRGKVWIRIFPDVPVSKKPAETRMGKGKGAPDHWVAKVLPGRVLFELGNVTRTEAQNALRLGAAKLGIRTRFVERLERV